jgi:general secretion pathway protein F
VPIYEYRGFDGNCKETSGIIDAESPRAARLKLRKQSIFPTDIDEKKADGKPATKGTGLSVQIDLSKYFTYVSATDVATMTAQLSTLVGASIPVVEALSAVLEQSEKPALKVVLADVREKVNEGASLAQSLKGHPKVFDELYTNMVAAGEKSGALELVLKRLADHTEAMGKLRGKVVAALIYPALMAMIGAGLLITIFTVVIPRVRRMFDSFHAGLPLLTRALLGASDIVGSYWWIVLALIALGVWLFRRWVKKPAGRERWHALQLKTPVIGKIVRTIAVSRFCRTLATLLVSGVPILTALEIVRRVVQNDVLARAIGEAAKNIQEGQSIAVPLRQSGQFPPLVTHMISIGERTGELEPMLDKVANAYDAYVERSLSAFTALLEPLLIIAMGGTIGIVALALLLPMLQLSRLAGLH